MKLVHSQAERPQRNSLPSHILIPFLSILVVSAIVSVRFEVFRLDSSPPNPKRREKLVPDVFNSPKKALMEAGDTKVGQEYEKNAEIDVSIVVEEAQQDSDKKDERKENRIPEWIDPFRPPHNAKPPAWCEILINNPREFPRGELYGECGRKHNDVLCADGKPMYFGSHNQDMYTYNHHFKNLNRPGVFLDIAANDPVSRSNTFFYEKCLGWKGLCIEANPRYHDLLHRMRTCAIVKTCVSDKVMNVTFVDDAGNGGILSTNKNRETAKKRNKFRKMTCVKTDTALLQGEKMEIDWFSLDVEGHELFVLKGIDWTTTKINLITIENRSKEIRKFLLEKGYYIKEMDKDEGGKVAYGQMWNDVLYVHESVVWGKPV